MNVRSTPERTLMSTSIDSQILVCSWVLCKHS